MPFFLEGRSSAFNFLFSVSAFYKDYSHELMRNGLDFLLEKTFTNFKAEKFSVIFLEEENLVTIFLGDASKLIKDAGSKHELVKAEELANTLAKFSLSNQYLKFSFRNLVNTEILKFSSIKTLGSLELPQVVSFALSKVKFDGIIAIGVIKKGKTSHDHFVSSECYRGLSDVAIKHHIPLTTAIINSDSEEVIQERISKSGYNVGKQAVETCLELISIKRKIDTQL